MTQHHEDPATIYILERIKDVSRRLEDALALLEKRTEMTAVSAAHLATAQQDIEQIYRLLLGDGLDRPGLQQRYQEIVPRLESIETAIDELDGTARLSRLENEMERVTTALELYEAISTEDRKGEWLLKVETHKGKLAVIAALIAGVLASGFLGQLFRWLIDKLK